MLDPTLTDAIGLIAAGLTLATFAQRRMLPMRLTAITANVFFIGYGSMGAHLPVLGLHVILLPLNLLRLRDLRLLTGECPVQAVRPDASYDGSSQTAWTGSRGSKAQAA